MASLEFDLALLRVGLLAVEDGDVADEPDLVAVGFFLNLLGEFTLFVFALDEFDLDEFVVVQCDVDGADDGFGQTRLAHIAHGFEVVRH